MLLSYDSEKAALVEGADLAAAAWVHAVEPSEADLAALRALGVDAGDIVHALDPHEVARVAVAPRTALVVLRVPWKTSGPDDLPYRAATAGVLLNPDGRVVTIARAGTDVFDQTAGKRPNPAKPWSLVLSLIEACAESFLRHLRELDRAVDALEDQLERSLRNREVLELLRYQKSLVLFTTALASEEIMLDHLARHARPALDPEELEQLDDVLVEVRQAREMCSVAQNMLGEMMDAFASIISNNLNVVMKVLTMATVVLAIPTLITSAYGMNIQLPGQHAPAAFATLVLLSAVLSVALLAWLRRLRWL